jgi:CheY-like chemotaxis protein
MSKKILLADDSLTIQKVVELTFSDSDFDLVCVGNGSRALERVHEDRPDVILADVVMPEKNGYEVCEAIKGDPATSRIPVVLLTGTFEPFDRARAERIGADAIVSKPFDSQQLISQVEALLARSEPEAQPAEPAIASGRYAARPSREARDEGEAEPFEVGFTPEDFTGSIRVPFGHEQTDPFEEEYGRADGDAAFEAVERTGRESAAAPPPAAGAGHREPPEAETFRESAWLEEEPERPAEHAAAASEEPPRGATDEPLWAPVEIDAPRSLEFAPPVASETGSASSRADEGPTLEIVRDELVLEPPPIPPDSEYEEISAEAAEVLFDVPEGPEEEVEQPAGEPAEASAAEEPVAPAPQELEALAQTSSIPELAQMLSSVSRTAGGELSDAEIDRLATRVVEKLSDRIVREIAWEVIPDMAEIVIKQRIKELESGIE